MAISKQEITSVVLEVTYRLFEEMSESEVAEFKAEQDKLHAKLPFDSLNLVSLVVELEDELEKRYDVRLSLADERAVSHEVSPFSSVDSLSAYICSLLSEALSVSEPCR